MCAQKSVKNTSNLPGLTFGRVHNKNFAGKVLVCFEAFNGAPPTSLKKNRQTILIISFKFHEKYMFYHLKIQD